MPGLLGYRRVVMADRRQPSGYLGQQEFPQGGFIHDRVAGADLDQAAAMTAAAQIRVSNLWSAGRTCQGARDQDLVMRPVEDAGLAPGGQAAGVPPQVVVAEFRRGRRLETGHADSLRVHAAHHVPDRAVLAARIDRLQTTRTPRCPGRPAAAGTPRAAPRPAGEAAPRLSSCAARTGHLGQSPQAAAPWSPA